MQDVAAVHSRQHLGDNMAISYPLAFPTQTGVATIELSATNSVAITESPFTLKQQVVTHTGQRWGANVSMPPMKRADAEVWVSFLLSLRGSSGTFLMGDPIGATARGSASSTPGTPVVNGSGQTGGTLSIDGLPVSATGYLKAGDYIQLGGGSSATLHKVLADVNSNASGQATLDIWPHIRTAPADDATVVVANAKGVFRLADNETNWSINQASFYGISFAAFEAIA